MKCTIQIAPRLIKRKRIVGRGIAWARRVAKTADAAPRVKRPPPDSRGLRGRNSCLL